MKDVEGGGVVVRSVCEADWLQLRTLRLEMLADTPIAFGETLEDAERASTGQWRERATRGEAPGSILIAAIERESGRWVGTMGGIVTGGETGTADPLLIGVYVSPPFRGREHGVAEAMLRVIERWAARLGPALRLRVHEDNLRAQAFYRRLGYTPNGRSGPYVLDPAAREIEMTKPLRSPEA